MKKQILNLGINRFEVKLCLGIPSTFFSIYDQITEIDVLLKQALFGEDNVKPVWVVVVSSGLIPYLNMTGWAVPHGRVLHL